MNTNKRCPEFQSLSLAEKIDLQRYERSTRSKLKAMRLKTFDHEDAGQGDRAKKIRTKLERRLKRVQKGQR